MALCTETRQKDKDKDTTCISYRDFLSKGLNINLWNHARYCLREKDYDSSYPEVFVQYCERGGVGQMQAHEAKKLFLETDTLGQHFAFDDLIGINHDFSNVATYRARIRTLIKDVRAYTPQTCSHNSTALFAAC